MVNYQHGPLDAVFGALADPTRRAMIARLAHGAATVGALGAPFALTPPAVTKHLNVLEDAGLIVRRKVGRERHCSLAPERLREAEAWIGEMRRFWETQLDSFARYLESAPDDPKAEGRHGRRRRAKRQA
ncbi:MAG: ArsR/SmtB family transcription factor [Rhodospirillaceae bacterium]